MALKLVRSGPVTRPGVVQPGSGWINVTGADPNNLSNPYWFGYSGYCLMTVTAWNVDGLRVLDWGMDRFLESRFPGAAHSVSGVLDLSQRSAVVRVLNPTDKAEIIINWVPLSLSRRGLGQCRRRNHQAALRLEQVDGYAPRPLDDREREFHHPHPRHLPRAFRQWLRPVPYPAVGVHTHPQPGGYYQPRHTQHDALREGRNRRHRVHHQTRLTLAGGGR